MAPKAPHPDPHPHPTMTPSLLMARSWDASPSSPRTQGSQNLGNNTATHAGPGPASQGDTRRPPPQLCPFLTHTGTRGRGSGTLSWVEGGEKERGHPPRFLWLLRSPAPLPVPPPQHSGEAPTPAPWGPSPGPCTVPKSVSGVLSTRRELQTPLGGLCWASSPLARLSRNSSLIRIVVFASPFSFLS